MIRSIAEWNFNIEQEIIARVFSKTFGSLPVEGYGKRKIEVYEQWKRMR